MDRLSTTETLVKPTTPMDASDALYLDTLCDRRDAAMLSPFTGADHLLDLQDGAGESDEEANEPALHPAPN